MNSQTSTAAVCGPIHKSQICMTRREFVKKGSWLTAGVATVSALPSLAAAGANEKLRVAIIGCNGRGMAHISAFLGVGGVEIAAICDVDKRALDKGIAAVAKKQGHKPQGFQDLRRLLDDKEIDAVSIATPDHWHAPAAILACAAGKHVYVEKPGSHNGRESEWIVAAARKHKRVVQMGNQRRSWPWVIEAIQAVKNGELGKSYFARCWYTNRRPSIGRGKTVPVPEWLDFSLWQGPAPERPYKDNLVHYNWHWFWHWATAELGNNGVHSLDLARWGLEIDLPTKITCGGNRYFFQDDWETPDTTIATFDFGSKGIIWEGQSCAPRGFEGAGFGVSFHAENGTLVIAGDSAVLYDLNQKVLRQIKPNFVSPADSEVLHFSNFVQSIRDGVPLAAEIEEGQKSTLLCHLGNIAYRTGHTLAFDPRTRKIIDDKAALALWGRSYRKGWEPKV